MKRKPDIQFNPEELQSESVFRLNKKDGKMPYFRCGTSNQSGTCNTWGDGTLKSTDEYAVNYILEGEGIYEDETGISTALYPGCILQRFPGRRHIEKYHSSKVIRIFIAAPRELYNLLILTNSLSSHQPVIYYGIDPSVVTRIQELTRELKTATPNQLSDFTVKSLQFLIYLHRRIQIQNQEVSSHNVELIEQAKEVLERDFAEKNTLQSIAKELNTGYSNFRNVFKRHVGISPGEYRIQKRIEYAQQLLQNEDYSIKEIADLLSYSDQFTFSKQFKKVTGISPTKFQRKILI